MQCDDGIRGQTCMPGIAHQVFNGILVVQDHLGFQCTLTLSDLAEFDQAFGVQTAISVALKLRRGPGKINQQAVENIACKGACGGMVGW